MDIDQSRLNFDDSGILVLNITLAIIMFGVALGIKVDDFKAIAHEVSGGFVSEDNGGIVDQRPGNCYPLALKLDKGTILKKPEIKSIPFV